MANPKSRTFSVVIPIPYSIYLTIIDILPALKGEDSPKGIFRLRVSSVLKYAFAWNVEGCHRVVTNGVRYSAYSPVNGAFLPVNYRRRRRLAIQPAREHGSRQPNCYAVHGSPSRCAIFSEAFRSACRPRPHSEHEKCSPSRVPIEPHSEHR